MKVWETQRSIDEHQRLHEGACHKQHFHVVVCLEPGEVAAFHEALYHIVIGMRNLNELTNPKKP